MPNQTSKSGSASILLGIVSAACLMFALTAQAEGGKNEATMKPGESSGQSSNSSGMTSMESSNSSGAKVSKADERLMMQLAQANIAEINAGKLAEQKSSNDQVKSFAKKMVDDHTKALDDLKQLATSKGVTLPTDPDRQQMAMENKLSALSGGKFDAQYVDQSGSRAHKDTHRLLQRVSSRAADADLKAYANKIMPTVESHQQLAKETSKNLTMTTEGRSGSGMEGGGSNK
jgi:putative membrane protein